MTIHLVRPTTNEQVRSVITIRSEPFTSQTGQAESQINTGWLAGATVCSAHVLTSVSLVYNNYLLPLCFLHSPLSPFRMFLESWTYRIIYASLTRTCCPIHIIELRDNTARFVCQTLAPIIFPIIFTKRHSKQTKTDIRIRFVRER